MKNASLFNIMNWNKLQDSQLIHAGFSTSDRISYTHFDDGIIIKDMQFSSSNNFHNFFDGFFRFCAAERIEFIQYMTKKNDSMYDWFISAEWEPYLLEDTEDGLVFMVYDINVMEKLNFFRSYTEK